MKIKIKKRDFEKVAAMPRTPHFAPLKPLSLLRLVIRIASIPDLLATRFEYTAEGCEILKREPCLILMNHSSFIDLKIASALLFPRKYNIVMTIKRGHKVTYKMGGSLYASEMFDESYF